MLAGLGAGGGGPLQSTPPFTCPPPPTKGKVRGWRGSAQSSQAGEGGEGRGTGTPALLVVLLYWLACPPALSSPEGACAAARGDTHVGGQVGVELGGPHESGSQEEPPCSPPPRECSGKPVAKWASTCHPSHHRRGSPCQPTPDRTGMSDMQRKGSRGRCQV